MKQIVMPEEIKPGDVYLSHVDQRPHWVDEIVGWRFHQDGADRAYYGTGDIDTTKEPLRPIDEPVLALICEGGRRIEVHHLSLPVLIERPTSAVVEIRRAS